MNNMKQKPNSYARILTYLLSLLAIVSFTRPLHALTAEYSEFDCDNGNTGWRVDEKDEEGHIVRWTVGSCDGDITNYPLDVVNHPNDTGHLGHVIHADSVHFSGVAGNWNVSGYLNHTPVYGVHGSMTGVSITFGGYSIKPKGEGGELYRSSDDLLRARENGSLVGKIVGYVPKADSVSFLNFDDGSWQVSGYFKRKNVYIVKSDLTGTRVVLPQQGTSMKSEIAPLNSTDLSNLKAFISNGKLTISCTLARAMETTIHIYDDLGQLLDTYNAGILPAGESSIQLRNPISTQSGVYIARITAGGADIIQKFVSIK